VHVGEFGLYDELSDRAHSLYQDGDAAGAIERCHALEVLCAAADDEQTLRYALYIRGIAANELGHGDEAWECAERLFALVADDPRPYWQAKALALQANAQSGRGDFTGALDLLAHASVLVDDVVGRDYNQRSANGAIALALRRVELFEASDTKLRRIISGLEPWDVITIVADSLHTVAEWGLALQAIGQAEAAATQFAACASRAAWLRRLVGETGRTTFELFAQTGEIFAATMLGDSDSALRLLPALLLRDQLRRERVDRLLAHFALSVALVETCRYDEAEVHLSTLRALAIAERRSTWVAIADAALMRMYVHQFGDHPAVAQSFQMYQRLAQSQWTERSARFDNLQTRMRVHRLVEEGAQIAKLTRRDALTGVGNRRVLEGVLTGPSIPVSAVFIDIDNFKAVNDEFSHVIGDRVLVRLSTLLRSVARYGDRVVRYGGDEFLIVLDPREAGAMPEGAVTGLAQRVLDAVRTHAWSELAPGLVVTVSVGVVAGAAPADLLTAASEALHQAKTSGRNRLSVGS